ncbi:9853_t:CDS:2, partial [Entrophospora sp. SA101]
YPLMPRNIFKEASNSLLWTILNDIVNINNINLNFVKVKGHSGDHFNDKVDELARLTHAFIPDNLFSISYTPRWNNIIVEKHLRHFITDLSRNHGFVQFINLYRNNKYREVDVDWCSSFAALNDDEVSINTSFKASLIKIRRIKYLTKELPTVEHVKKRCPDLYKHWNCPMCHDEIETFEHVWKCKSHKNIIDSIIFNNKKRLVKLVKMFTNNKQFSTRDLQNESIWKINSNEDEFNFIDLIKGVAPLSLAKIINNSSKNKSITQNIISVFLNNIFLDTEQFIWSPHCDQFILEEQHAASGQEGVHKSIILGEEWLQYYSGSLID